MAFICGSHLPVPRPLLQPTDRPATCPFLPLPSHLTGAPPPINMHRLQLTHSFIHLAAARFHGLSARKPGPNESEPPHQNPRTAPIQYHPTVHSRPNQTKTVQTKPSKPTVQREAAAVACHSVFQALSLFSRLFPRFGYEMSGEWVDSCLLSIESLLYSAYVCMYTHVYVRTHLCVHPRVYILRA